MDEVGLFQTGKSLHACCGLHACAHKLNILSVPARGAISYVDCLQRHVDPDLSPL